MMVFVTQKIIDFIENHYSAEEKIKIYCLGLAFKGNPETSDMRCSPAVDVIRRLKSYSDRKLELCGYDAVVSREDVEALGLKYLTFKEGFQDAHCVLIMNNHYEFTKMDIFDLLLLMKKPGFIFDGWRHFSPEEIKKIKGIVYQGLGGFN